MTTARIHTELLAPSYSLQDLDKLRDLFRTLSNGVKAIHQYPPGHPVARGFVQIFEEKLAQFFAQNQLLSTRITREGILAGDGVIVAMGQEPDNLASIFHRDGVRLLEVKPGITTAEVEDLLTSLAMCSGPEQERRDLGNLFWQAQFENIEYEIVDLFEIEDVELTWPEGSEEKPDLAKELQFDPEQMDLRASPLEQQFRELFGDLHEFPESELAQLRQMLTEHRMLDLRSEGIMLLLDIYADSDSLNEQVAAIDKLKIVLDQCIHEARFATLASFLERAASLTENEEASVAKRQRLSGFMLRCGDSVRIGMITKVLNDNDEIELEPVRAYLRFLTSDATANLIQMLGDLEHYPARKMICDLLVEKDLGRIDVIGNAVYDSRWYLVRNIVWILGEAGVEQGITFVSKAATHSDDRVRLEVVKALGKINTDAAVRVLVEMLNDESERIATMAANELGNTHSPVAYEALAGLVGSKDYSYLPVLRMRQLAEALVSCDGDRALEMVQEAVQRRTWLGRARLRQMQEVLINAMQFADSEKAASWLQEIGRKKTSPLAAAARKALRQMKSRRERSDDGN